MFRGLQLRLWKNRIFHGIIIIFAFLITLPLFAIIYYVVKTGITQINWNFLTNIPQPVGEIGGGIANALIGSILIVLVATVIAVPLGLLCGINLRVNTNSRF